MSLQKRSSASSSSNQPDQPKRPRFFPIKQERSCLTEGDVRRVIKEELEHATSLSAKYCQSCTGNALEEITKQMRPMMENFLQEMKEAFGLAKIHSPHLGRANARSTANNYTRNLQLQLQTKLSLPLFTGKKLEGEKGTPISVALIDANTGDVVTSGPESSIKLDIVVLEGDFNKEDGDNWAQEEFENYVVKERDGKRPLLTGNLIVTLKGGVGELGELIFTDNSSWNKSKRFRIGLKVATGYCGNTRIQEAKTEAFRVKEYRGEAYKKHHPPASDDEVWRLEKIAKDGKSHQKLKEAGIHKVEDFLLQLLTDSKKLREILGNSITSKNWEILVHHTKTCKTNSKLYLYYPDGMTMHGAIFTLDGQLIGLIEDRAYFATHQLSAQEKEHGDSIVKKAFDNWNDVREFNGETFSGSMQKKSSSTFPSQVLEGQTDNLTPVQRNLAPRISAAPVGLEAPPAIEGSTAEGHTMEISVDGSVRLAAHQSISPDRCNVLISPGDNVDQNVLPSEPTYASISSFQSGSTPPLPGGSPVTENFQSIVPDYVWDYLLADDGGSFQTPTWENT
ncbi:calmodulin-binding protein 60 D-like isoform X2 [Syzygium oleosum]|uniref:calmodulin-binding protein 60 D-like isoform X2 n=1 Tax=Syzygium oleosum TaxID=219896 RepID=UPI0024B8BCC8|nr:calmodulin-binding protein 60 D-like isoform X2 [Syzygium oleosum]